MKKVGWIIVLCLLVSCSQEREPENEAVMNNEPVTNDQMTVTAENLEAPWDIEVHQGTFYISERKGDIVSTTKNGKITRLPVQTEKGITQMGEGGLLGLKLHPDFANNHRAYAYHTYEEGDRILNRVILIEKQGDRWVEVGSVLEEIPGARFHNGGRIEIGPDGYLYVTTGDSLNEQLAQDQTSLAGKILRLALDGSIPEDNPFPDSYVYSYGHRNPQGITWNEKGEMFASEHGPDNHDEINWIEPGRNYGWPTIVGDESRAGMVTPLYQTGNDTWAPSGITVYNGKIYVASLRGTAVRTITFKGENPQVVTDQYGRIRDVEMVDDKLYFITNNTDGRGNPRESDDRLIHFSK